MAVMATGENFISAAEPHVARLRLAVGRNAVVRGIAPVDV